MPATALQLRRPSLPRRAGVPSSRRTRWTMLDGARTTLHVASFPLETTTLRVLRAPSPRTLLDLCADEAVDHALVGGFFDRADGGRPLGQLVRDGVAEPTTPFTAPWGDVRACVHADADGVHIARRGDLPDAPLGDLLQAGPLLVAGGRAVAHEGEDPEGFSAASEQFDSDITAIRHPRAALAVTGEALLAVVADGRSRRDAGTTLPELADALVALGARDALNLDGGGSASLVVSGRLRNRPREIEGTSIVRGRPIATALAFVPA